MTATEYCIVSAGVGSRFAPFSNYANKALAPVPFSPIICEIIDKIPSQATIHIVVGYKGNDLKHILKLYYPSRNIAFYENENYESTGMGDSLMEVLSSTQSPLLIMPNDGIYDLSLDNYCLSNQEYSIGCQVAGPDASDYLQIACNNESGTVESFSRGSYIYNSTSKHDLIFSGLLYIKHPEKFHNILSSCSKPREIYSPFTYLLDNNIPIQIFNVNWIDCGTYAKYKAYIQSITPYDFSKTAEALLLNRPYPVIKIFEDSSIALKRVNKSEAFSNSFPKCSLLPSKSGYSYNFVDGVTLYEAPSVYNLRNLLKFLSTNLWKYTAATSLRKDALNFYQKKTEERILLLKSKYDLDKIKYINGTPISGNHILPNFPFDRFIESIYPSPIHGDLQYDNCLVTQDDGIVLLDWRHEFGSNNLIGDLYYDLAKLMGGIYINYKRIKECDFWCELNADKDTILYSYDTDDYIESHLQVLKEFIYSKNLSYKHCQLLMSLVFVNMSPLHEYPFDLFLLALSHQIFNENAF